MKFEIRSRRSGGVLFSLDAQSLKLAIEAAVKSGANLTGANLTGVNLISADLYGANLISADLTGANLYGADLYGADLTGADLTGANLTGADLISADLTGANLISADLTGANLYGADLYGADLTGANLTTIRDDIWAVLSSSPSEVVGLRQAVLDGTIDGSTYEGACCCLVGTLAKNRRCGYRDIPTLTPNASRPAERFFAAIRPGDTPENSQFSQVALEWVDQWLANMTAAFGGKA